MNAPNSALKIRLQTAQTLAERAGSLLLSHRGRLRAIERKGAVDLVTEADRASESLIVAALRSAFAEDGIIGEESGPSGPSDAPWTWVIDPLDGTTNFVHGQDAFAVSIGLMDREGLPVLGVVHAPVWGETWSGGPALGTFNRKGERLQVSTESNLGDALLGTGFPYDRADRCDEILAILARAMVEAQGIRRHGAASLELVDIARGALDGFWEPSLAPWDMAAGAALILGAGGRLSTYGGAPFHCRVQTVLASNGPLHDALTAMVGPAPNAV